MIEKLSLLFSCILILYDKSVEMFRKHKQINIPTKISIGWVKVEFVSVNILNYLHFLTFKPNTYLKLFNISAKYKYSFIGIIRLK